MKHLLLILFAVVSAATLCAQEQSVMVKEPAGQCYLDLKAHLPEAIRWDDNQMLVRSRPLVTTMAGNVEVIARIFPEYGLDKKTKERVEMCKIAVMIYAPQYSTAWNSWNSSSLFQTASLLKARVEGAMKTRKKETH